MTEVNYYKPSAKVIQILNSYANRALRRNVFEDCWTRLLVSAACYWVEINAGDVVIDDKVFEILKDYIFDMNEEFEAHELETMFEKDYTQIIEHCCNMFDKDFLSSNIAQHSQPRELTKFICDLITQDTLHPFKEGSSVYMPFAGYCSEIVSLDNRCQYDLGVSCKIDADEISSFSWAISVLRLEANALFLENSNVKANIYNEDSFKKLSEKDSRYDYVIFTPPFGIRTKDGYNEYDAVHMAIDNKLVEGGTLCCVLPASFLTNTGKAGKLREYLLKNGYIDTIISLPRIFSPYTNINTIVLIVRKQKQSEVRLIDGTSFVTPGRKENGGGRLSDTLSNVVWSSIPDYCINISLENILQCNSLLIPQIALSQVVNLAEGERLCQLRDIISTSSVRPSNLDKDVNHPVKHTIRHLFETPYNCDVQLDAIPYEDSHMYYMPKAGVYHFEMVETPSLVAQIVGDSVKVGKISSQGRVLVLCKRNTLFFNVNSEVVIQEYLLLQLQSDYVKKQINAFATGTSVPTMNLIDLLDIRVVIPSVERQKEIIMHEMAKDIYALNIELERSFSNYKKDIHTRKHALVQIISSLSSHWNVLNNLRKKNNGIIDCSSTIGIANPIPVSSKFDTITNLITSISKFVEHLADIDYSWGPEVEINLTSFVDEYIKKNSTHDFLMYNSTTVDNEEFNIIAPIRAIEQVFQNIVSNAIEHGFTDSTRNDYQIKFDVYEEDGNIIIVISNNGNPLREDVTLEMVLTDGFSTSLNEKGHQGIGGNEIKSIMSELGSVEIISNPEGAFPVGYKLTFKKTNYNY